MKTNFKILWSGQFFTILGLTGITPFLPFYMVELGTNGTRMNLLWSGCALAAPAISYAIATPFWGKVSDRWSRKWMVVRSLVGLALSLIFMGMAQTPFQFFLARLCQGAFGGIMDASTSFVGSEAPKEKQGLFLGKLQNAVAVGSLTGPLVGGVFGDIWGFRPLLVIMGVATGLCAMMAAIVLKEKQREKQKKPSPASARVWGTLGYLLSDPKVRAYLFAGIAAKFSMFGLLTIFGPYVQTIITSSSITTTWVGILDAAAYIGAFIGSSWWGKQNDCKPIRKNYLFATIFCGISVILQAFLQSVEWMFMLRIVQGFFYSALIQSVLLTVIRSTGDENRGLRIGATNSLLMLGQISGSVMGATLGGFLALEWVFILMGSVFIIGSVSVLLIPRPKSSMEHAQRL
jgi:MFS family permease